MEKRESKTFPSILPLLKCGAGSFENDEQTPLNQHRTSCSQGGGELANYASTWTTTATTLKFNARKWTKFAKL
jgi:hypothetical protein